VSNASRIIECLSTSLQVHGALSAEVAALSQRLGAVEHQLGAARQAAADKAGDLEAAATQLAALTAQLAAAQKDAAAAADSAADSRKRLERQLAEASVCVCFGAGACFGPAAQLLTLMQFTSQPHLGCCLAAASAAASAIFMQLCTNSATASSAVLWPNVCSDLCTFTNCLCPVGVYALVQASSGG
jgi:ABC-type transporter Mla subunit MlaD